jgi:hypothetical protein
MKVKTAGFSQLMKVDDEEIHTASGHQWCELEQLVGVTETKAVLTIHQN